MVINKMGNSLNSKFTEKCVRPVVLRIGLLLYVMVVLYITVFSREVTYFRQYSFEFLDSYIKWMRGNTRLGVEILQNIALFVPIGYWVSFIQESSGSKRSFLYSLITGFVLSLGIETVQLIFKVGFCEADDLLNNTLGAVLGAFSYVFFTKIIEKKCAKLSFVRYYLPVLFLGFGLVICFTYHPNVQSIPEREFGFQIEESAWSNEVTFTGYCFPYGQDAGVSDYEIILKSMDNGTVYRLNTVTGISRPDVNTYFECKYNYTKCGFTAKIDGDTINGDEFEVLVKWKGMKPKTTGIYVKRGLLYFNKKMDVTLDTQGTYLEEIVNQGYLLVNEPDYSCYVFQYHNKLYWVTDQHFFFDDDGKTHIQYQMWTTQEEKLPEERLKNEWYWDNLSFNFEEYEITDQFNCGKYRVAVKDLPQNYSITAIVTGYCSGNQWIWKNYFRPITRELM